MYTLRVKTDQNGNQRAFDDRVVETQPDGTYLLLDKKTGLAYNTATGEEIDLAATDVA